MADDDVVVITDNELLALKREVLAENIDEISNQLGDPGRYFATFKAKNLLDQSDCEHIKGQTTSIEKAMRFIDLIRERDGRNGEHSYDVLVNALKRMKVHIHIVRILNQALAKKRSELKIKKRVSQNDSEVIINIPSGFPSNGQIQDKGPVQQSSNKSTSSPSSSSLSSYTTTSPSYLPSPQNDTDQSLVSSRSSLTSSSRISSSEFPPLPEGFDETGAQLGFSKSTVESSFQATPTTSEVDPETGPIPALPVGYNQDGSRQDSITTIISSSPQEFVHPDFGPIPPLPIIPMGNGPVSGLPFRSNTEPTIDDHSLMVSLQQKIIDLQYENEKLKERNQHLDKENQEIKEILTLHDKKLNSVMSENEKLTTELKKVIEERDKLSYSSKHLESHINAMKQGRGKVLPTRLSSPGLPNPNNIPVPVNSRRQQLYAQQRTSDSNLAIPPSMYQVSRPKNLPLFTVGGQPQQHLAPSPRQTPLNYSDIKIPSKYSPGSDSSRDGHLNYYKISSSADDLTSGEDQGSVRSFDSNHSDRVIIELSSAGNTHGTVV